jgi:hypothetical protein
MRRVLWVGAGAAAATARVLQRARRRARDAVREEQSLTVQAIVSPELVADLTDLLGKVTGRAASDREGAIRIKIAPGTPSSDAIRDLRSVLDRWSEIHPGIQLRIMVETDSKPARRRAAALQRRFEIPSRSK